MPAGQARATIGGQNATVLFLGLTPGAVGLAQANVQIPAQLTTGDYPLVLTVNGQTSRSALVAVKGIPLPPAILGPLPVDFKCVSGSVDFITFSLATKASRLADEVSIGGTKLCASCQLKQPVYGNLVEKLEAARVDGLNVDACYDPFGTMSYLRLRP